ncbi:unknown protein [Microcystis aeruginosa NIES-843]|uniref:Uncharacterized protein n=1 Tax=Microcystis aeruginosa (strain NIES-843 / IAM M-2473) TaxID=449447 RepID=B0JRQ7_MICAN|nr:unknown protein [Microcystis aeruginosa NIES-843]
MKQQPNPTPKADSRTIHTPPPQMYQKLQFNKYLHSYPFRFVGFWGVQELEIVQ